MLTKNEITALNLSPTKKDFVQIWNELIEVAGKLSERWDPTSTNESDPGIVILKALTGIADKLNYNIDKNTLEAFMPTAAQEDSMRKLCDMLGYNVKYYRSAETTVTIKYYDPSAEEDSIMRGLGLIIPKFTVISNGDQDVNYFTVEPSYYISTSNPTVTVPCMEGQIVKCESINSNNVITINQISDNNRYYLPEYQIAENGIFVYNAASNIEDGTQWKKVDNLNIQARGARVFKFGYDSYEGRPYIEFPEDYTELINDGLFIYYTRTSGASGNISAKTLTQIELPSGEDWNNISAESFSIENSFAATTGSNVETINQAYNNFKKTVGTFETLVTCRDYMNKIYNLTDDETGRPIVSNALVTDIRSDLNRAVTICSCDDAGIFYKETPLIESKTTTIINTKDSIETIDTGITSSANKPVYNGNRRVNGSNWFLGSAVGMPLTKATLITQGNSSSFDPEADGDVDADTDGYWHIYQPKGYRTWNYKTVLPVEKLSSTITVPVKTITETVDTTNAIDHFDLVLYPFKSYNQIRGNVKNIQDVYDSSFYYHEDRSGVIANKINNSDIKTIAHNILAPRESDIVSINNYLRLNAIIGTNSKITYEEGLLLKDTIKIALANAFNMRELDFGEEIPFESILSVIENADSRIKVVSLAEPELYTTYSVFGGYNDSGSPNIYEYAVASKWLSDDTTNRFDYNNVHTFDVPEAKKIYNKLALRNVLAGRVPLFKYNTTYATNFSEGAYRVTDLIPYSVLPTNLQDELVPSEEKPFTIKHDQGNTYTGQWIPLAEQPSDLDEFVTIVDRLDENGEPAYAKIVYTKTYSPEDYANNVIAKEDDKNITEITTSCVVKSDKDADGKPTYKISEVTLSEGEFIKFRAPNFVTTKTFPAYVNYHLDLGTNRVTESEYATAHTLHSLLNSISASRGLSIDARRQEVLDYFGAVGLKKTFTLAQKIAKYSDSITDDDNIKTGNLTIEVDNPDTISISETPTQLLAKSGFVRIVNKKATLKWDTSSGVTVSGVGPDLDFPELSLGNSSYIIDANVFNNIQEAVDNYLNQLRSETPQQLPTNCDWIISYTFEYVPFDVTTLATWSSFIAARGSILFGFKPIEEHGNILWRAYDGGYSAGKYILSSTAKLLPFTSGHFGSLESLTNRLFGIYITEDIGHDVKASFISNNEEYMLRDNEYLYIEYTPSTTSEDGTTQEQEPVKEVFGPGKIIRPSGFENGLVESTEYASSGNTAHKEVVFEISSSTTRTVPLFSLGANEQIEIRDFSQVALDKDTLPNASSVYIYKNFNNCPELETIPSDGSGYSSGQRQKNTYTLKDGEYIFYTDQNQVEFAYFTSGTEVTLAGKTVLPRCDIIDLAAIFDNGIQEIPWQPIKLEGSNGIIFKEFQYVTLGSGDTLQELTLEEKQSFLNEDWQKCDDVSYIIAGSTTPSKLPKINISDAFNNGNGWEVCSILELNVSPNSAQTLRSNEKIETSITLHKEADSGLAEQTITVAPTSKQPLSFKTNLACQSSNSQLKLSDVYTNPDNIKSFELKVFEEETPSVVKTTKNNLIPYISQTDDAYLDIKNWPTNDKVTNILMLEENDSAWQFIRLSDLIPTEDYDNALKLAVTTMPNTYGIFSIYIDYRNFETENTKTWIELLPGVSLNNLTLINVEDDSDYKDASTNRLYLNSGINCVRVNNTSNIFIKTNAEDGVLYFDNIRLVDCQPLEYVRENGQVVQQVTQGLNLDQIGYLDTTDRTGVDTDTDTFNSFDMRIRRRAKTELTKQALLDLDELAEKDYEKFSAKWKEIKDYKTKLQCLIDFLSAAKKEIDLLIKNEDNDLIFKTDENLGSLFAKYKELAANLTREKELQDALDNNEDVASLERHLVSILSSFTEVENSRQELLTKVEDLKISAENNANSFTTEYLRKGDIIDDFIAVANTTDYPYLLEDIKFASRREINSRYGERLDALAADVETILDSGDKLNQVLNYLHTTKHETLLTQIRSLVSLYNESIITVLDTAKTQAELETVDYEALTDSLNQLKNYISTTDLRILISRIEATFENGLYAELAEAVNTLKSLLVAHNTATNAITAKIDELLVKIKTKLDSNNTTPDSTIQTLLATITADVNTYYNNKLQIIVDRIGSILDGLNASGIYDSLSALEDEQITAILSRVGSISEAVEDHLDSVNNFVETDNFNITTEYKNLPFGEEAIINTWPDYMCRALISGINQIYHDIRGVINGTSYCDTLSSNLSSRPVLAKASDIESFYEVFNFARNLISQTKQNDVRKSLINEISTLILPSDELCNAIEAVSISGDEKTLLGRFYLELQNATSIKEKQTLLSALKDELATFIDVDTQLVEISAKLLCPSILLFDDKQTEMLNDTFYNNFVVFVQDKRAEMLELDTSYSDYLQYDLLPSITDVYNINNMLVTALNNDKIADFTDWDTLNSAPSTTLLNDQFISDLLEAKRLFNTQDEVDSVKDFILFKILSDEDLAVAWQANSSQWVDSSGNYFINTTGDAWQTSEGELVNIKVKRTNDGVWRYHPSGEQIKIKDENAWITKTDSVTIQSNEVEVIINELLENTSKLGQVIIPSMYKDAYRIIELEKDLLRDLREIDKNRDFYYNVPVEAAFAITFNGNSKTDHTLMNPAVNYDINNINNNFVISKIDINYLTSGLQIARSSSIT